MLTLHDAWLLSGHCSHSFECQRWTSGCGDCPDLNIYPPIRRDATADNWQRKRAIYAQSRLHIATPSQWLMDRVQQSMLAPAVVTRRVIPNGIDLDVFRPVHRNPVRDELGVPRDARVLLFVASGIRENAFKDYAMLRSAIARVAERLPDTELLLLGLGKTAEPERIGHAEIRFVPYEPEPERLVKYYQAADLYLHAARADTFPTTVLEALGCGLPVVATALGGIPEQVNALDLYGAAEPNSMDDATGVLVEPGDASAMANAVLKLFGDPTLCSRLSTNAARDARRRFDLNDQCDAYLNWYREILAAWDKDTTNSREGIE